MAGISGRRISSGAVENIDAVRSGDVAAFAVDDNIESEQVVVLVQCRLHDEMECESLRKEIAAIVYRQAGVECQVVLIPPRSLPFTSSGKTVTRRGKIAVSVRRNCRYFPQVRDRESRSVPGWDSPRRRRLEILSKRDPDARLRSGGAARAFPSRSVVRCWSVTHGHGGNCGYRRDGLCRLASRSIAGDRQSRLPAFSCVQARAV